MVPNLSITFMTISCCIAFALPIGLFLYLRKNYDVDILAFVTGCAVMFVFSMMLESIAHQLLLNGTAFGQLVFSHPALYALYGGTMAGLFEETGRFLAFKTVLHRGLEKDANALMYGAGHGGFEAVALVGLTYISNIATARLINAGNMAAITDSLSGDILEQTQQTLQALMDTPSASFLLGGLERIPAVALQIALSVLVWFAVKKPERKKLFPLAILLHAVVDGFSVLLAATTLPLAVTEIAVAVMAAAVCLLAWRVWQTNVREEEAAE